MGSSETIMSLTEARADFMQVLIPWIAQDRGPVEYGQWGHCVHPRIPGSGHDAPGVSGRRLAQATLPAIVRGWGVRTRLDHGSHDW